MGIAPTRRADKTGTSACLENKRRPRLGARTLFRRCCMRAGAGRPVADVGGAAAVSEEEVVIIGFLVVSQINKKLNLRLSDEMSVILALAEAAAAAQLQVLWLARTLSVPLRRAT